MDRAVYRCFGNILKCFIGKDYLSRTFLKKLIVAQLVKKFPNFIQQHP
jgi:hypothetical protein